MCSLRDAVDVLRERHDELLDVLSWTDTAVVEMYRTSLWHHPPAAAAPMIFTSARMATTSATNAAITVTASIKVGDPWQPQAATASMRPGEQPDPRKAR